MPSYEGCLSYHLLSNTHRDEKNRRTAAETLRELGFRAKYYTFSTFTHPTFQRHWQWFVNQHLLNPQFAGIVAIIDKAYLESDYCRAELVMAKIAKLPIVALFVDDTPIPASFQNLFEDAVTLYCDSLDKNSLAVLAKLECLAPCREQTPLVQPDPDFEAYSDVLVKYHKNAETVIVPSGFTTVGEEAFMDCKQIKKIILPDTLRKISHSAFFNCESLTEILLPNGLESIDFRAFRNCRSLTEITLPKTIRSLKSQTFENCPSLRRVYVPQNVIIPSDTFLGDQTEIIRI